MNYNTTVGSINIKLNSKRIKGNIKEAQKALNLQIVADCTPLIPMQQGYLRESVIYPEGVYGGAIEWNTPYARYVYGGELYLTENGSSWAKYREKKYPSGTSLNYHPGTGDHWFDVAKQDYGKDWIKLVKKKAGKG